MISSPSGGAMPSSVAFGRGASKSISRTPATMGQGTVSKNLVLPQANHASAGRLVQRKLGMVGGTKVKVAGRPLPEQGFYEIKEAINEGKGGYIIKVLKKGKTEHDEDAWEDVTFKHWDVTEYIAPVKEEAKVEEEKGPDDRGISVNDTVTVPIRYPGVQFTVLSTRGGYKLQNVETSEEIAVVDRWMVLPTTKSGEKEEKKVEASNELLTDELLETLGKSSEAQAVKTPSVVTSWAKPSEGKTLSEPEKGFLKFGETARIDVNGVPGAKDIKLQIEIKCNPEYMSKRIVKPKEIGKPGEGIPKDLVPIWLEKKKDTLPECVTVLEPTLDENYYKFEATYTYGCLAKIFGHNDLLKLGDDEAIGKELAKRQPQFGVMAQWYANKGESSNGANHTSGGLGRKGGSGVVNLRPISLEDLINSEEKQRNTEWNMGERMAPGRPVYDHFSKILQAEKEMATTLEAESEFMVDQGPFTTVVERMKALKANPEYWEHFGIRHMGGSDTPKIYSDTYYDLQTKSQEGDLALLKNEIVLRRRSVKKELNSGKGDPDGTFLFSVKGASYKGKDEEMIRLASQINLDEEALTTEEGLEKLKEFLLDSAVNGELAADNAFSRVFNHALKTKAGFDLGDVNKEEKGNWTVKPVMQITSTRYKFLMELAHSTAIDFSADEAEGSVIDKSTGKLDEKIKPEKVYSFEFGVGHPGLTATNTASGGGSDGGGKSVKDRMAMFGQSTQEKAKELSGEIARPYHIEKDLENPALFEKGDYGQYRNLRDKVIAEAIGFKKGDLGRGGNKANVLAKKLGMIPDKK
ncbi:MAG: hypothetical protein H0T73_05335 [Ardenticatenales bacterium]|nr:hypothetical protein [Ardenticatenales bacterium]